MGYFNVYALANHRAEFIHLAIGTPGRVHDARVFVASGLMTELAPQFSVLGDGAYAFSDGRVVTPFSNATELSRLKKDFNNMQSSARMCIERAVGILKMRFRILLKLHYRDIGTIKHIVFVSCVLHNFWVRANQPLDPLEQAQLDKELLRVFRQPDPVDEVWNPKKGVSVEQQKTEFAQKVLGRL